MKSPSLKSGSCPVVVPTNFTDSKKMAKVVNQLLTEKYGPPCACGKGSFQRAIYLDMSNSSMHCPSNWRPVEGVFRGCGSNTTTGGCSSAVFPTSAPYNRVCGRINGYQKGSMDAFDQVWGATLDLEEHYVDGVSLTYGAPGSRQHIWTFAAAVYYADPRYITSYNCKCTNTGYEWNHPLPSFIGNNYFCESGNTGPFFDYNRLYTTDPLWDGEGCPSTSTCCAFNRPPWFCASLPQITTEDLEVRICSDQGVADEDVVISLIDIYTSTM